MKSLLHPLFLDLDISFILDIHIFYYPEAACQP